ncbi:hypothetical protein LuPra_01920 [Luteitalea pratensis]|uniref:Uncharacterized protein n=1 Tax=Luteitalea pratensis TaxID=1855912 RepID=A0A143PJX2_LUTPR|nr:hypothetical protein [Luteitalea pratensis]AMY08716.1 hypothetical protein LuPra_01920 [Luteitalea pratensis]
MPNWTEQQLHVVGTKADIDEFMRAGYTRRGKDETDNLLHFDVLCPPERRAEQRDEQSDERIESGVVLIHFRTRTQAHFEIITAWVYPADFYAAMAAEWPTLSFACTVAGEMGDFGGLVLYVGGKFDNIVEDFHHPYDRRGHLRKVRAALKRWMAFLTSGRDCRVMPHHAWDLGSMPMNVHFDGNSWFYFSSREDMATFRKRYRCHHPERRVDGEWKRTR